MEFEITDYDVMGDGDFGDLVVIRQEVVISLVLYQNIHTLSP